MTEALIRSIILNNRDTVSLALTRTLNILELQHYYNKFRTERPGFCGVIRQFSECTLYYSCFERDYHYIVPVGRDGKLAGMVLRVQDMIPAKTDFYEVD